MTKLPRAFAEYDGFVLSFVARETRVELATSCLEGRCSTTELLPRGVPRRYVDIIDVELVIRLFVCNEQRWFPLTIKS